MINESCPFIRKFWHSRKTFTKSINITAFFPQLNQYYGIFDETEKTKLY